MKKYIIYKTINLINNKFYIGAHQTENLNDDYLGSGVLLNKAIKKYGRENFKKEILHECSNLQDMYLQEQKIIDSYIGNEFCYNVKRGGIGGWNYINDNKLLVGDKNPMKNPEIVNKCKLAGIKTKNKNKQKYIDIANNNLKKAIEKNTGAKKPKHSKFMHDYMKNIWNKDKNLMRDRLSSWFIVIDPDNNEFKTNRLQDFCLQNNLPYTTIWKSSKDNSVIKKGKAKGWKCKIIQN